MLILFSVKNYRSFYEEQTLSLVASSYYGKKTDSASREARERQVIEKNLPGLSGRKYLRAVALYGANGSGKSNLTHAIATMKDIVAHSANRFSGESLPYRPFLLNDHAKKEPTSFFASFEWSGVRFEYDFEYNRNCILNEELYSFPKGHARLVFSRNDGENGIEVKFGTGFRVDSSVLSLVNRNALLLSFLYDHPSVSGFEAIKPAGEFFEKGLITLDRVRDRWANFPHSGEVLDGSAGTDYQRELIRQIIRDSDIGVTAARVKKRKVDPNQVERLQKALSAIGGDEVPEVPQELRTVLFEHVGSDGRTSIPLGTESLGTNQMFSLSSYIAQALEDDSTIVVDELDASLHPLLFEELIGLFERVEMREKTPQLIFTAHQTPVLNSGLLERDQIWLANKQSDGSTRLTPLSDYSPRKGEDLERGYLIGRFEGVPVLPRDYGVSRAGDAS